MKSMRNSSFKDPGQIQFLSHVVRSFDAVFTHLHQPFSFFPRVPMSMNSMLMPT